MEAVYTRGPIAVSLDASQPGFRFYSGGDPSLAKLCPAYPPHANSRRDLSTSNFSTSNLKNGYFP